MPDTLTILIVDDIFINHVILESILIGMGHNAESVKTGIAAVDALKENHYDLILMDINMPEMDGKTATRVIRQLPEPKSKIPIIACTADGTDKHMKEYKKIGMNGLIQKPIKKEELSKALDSCCNGGIYFPQTSKRDAEPDNNSNKKTTEALGKLLKKIGG